MSALSLIFAALGALLVGGSMALAFSARRRNPKLAQEAELAADPVLRAIRRDFEPHDHSIDDVARHW